MSERIIAARASVEADPVGELTKALKMIDDAFATYPPKPRPARPTTPRRRPSRG